MATRTSSARAAASRQTAPKSGARESTSLRLTAEEKALILKAAELEGEDFGTFIRNAARAQAEQVLEDIEYRKYMEAKVARAIWSLNHEPVVSHAEVQRRFGLGRKK